MIAQSDTHTSVAEHYARGGLIDAIRDGLGRMGKNESTVTADDLAPVDEFHIGGRHVTSELARLLAIRPEDRVLDLGCGLGGPARQIAAHYGCHVTGLDLTRDYVDTGNILSRWLRLEDKVSLQVGNALALPFSDAQFDAAYMIHVGMNIGDKRPLFAEAARVLRPGAFFGVYDVMRTGDGALAYPLPWASTAETNAVAAPAQYRDALSAAGFEIISERDRRDVALDYFARQRAQVSTQTAALGVQTLMGARRPEMVRNMSESISAGRVTPIEMVARRL